MNLGKEIAFICLYMKQDSGILLKGKEPQGGFLDMNQYAKSLKMQLHL